MTEFQTLTFEKHDCVGLLTLNKPERYNAISSGMFEELTTVLDSLVSDEGCRVLIITGAGKAFSAGLDLKSESLGVSGDLVKSAQSKYLWQKKASDVIAKMRQIPQPVIAAVNGVAAGAGMCLALAADVRVAAPSAKFNAAFINLGLTGGDLGSSYFLPRLVGLSRASEMLLTGRFVEAEEALSMGLVSRVTREGEVLVAAQEMAKSMLEKSVIGLMLTKELLNTTLQNSLEGCLQLENRQQVICMISGNVEAGITRFLNRKQS